MSAIKKRVSQKPPVVALTVCDFRHRDFCNGLDVRAIHPAMDTGGGPRQFHSFTRQWCAGCRSLMNGSFKYQRRK